MGLRFIVPTLELREPYLAYIRDWQEQPGHFVPAAGDLGGLPYSQWLLKREANQKEETVDPGLVPSTLYLLVDEENRVLGELDLRHRLTVGLFENGGHIGYGVAPAHRGHGYAAEMLRRAIPMARDLGIHLLLLTCLAENVASAKTIERCGGVFEGQVTRLDSYSKSEPVYRRYWIATEPGGVFVFPKGCEDL